jgi:phage tail P2-like protein
MDLLPPNATPQERALSNSTARVGDVPVPIRTLWNPQTCPVALLPWLAWAMSVDDWDSAWTEQQKRDVIAASVEVHRHKGTIGALKAALRPLNYDVQIEEPISLPYRFRIRIDPGRSNAMDVAQLDYSRAQQIALRVKNVRSWLLGVQAMRQSTSALYFGAATVSGLLASIYPYIVTNLVKSLGLYFALAVHSRSVSSIYPLKLPARLTEDGGYRLLENDAFRSLE